MKTDRLYSAAWRLAPKLPLGLLEVLSGMAADVATTLDVASVRRLRANHERLSGGALTPGHVRSAVRSYFRYFAQAFALPGVPLDKMDGWVRLEDPAGMLTAGAHDGPVVLALTHSGNWDLAGAWVSQKHHTVLTVAEKLDPPELFESFVRFREGLGMEIIGAGKGDSVFRTLVDRARGRDVVVALLADRDITGAGIEVDLGGSRALVAAGPAALSLELGRPLVAGSIRFERRSGRWGIVISVTDPVGLPEHDGSRTDVEVLTQAWVSAVEPLMKRDLVDWHMMQPLFTDDLDPERLRRARERHRAKLSEEPGE